MKKCGYSFWGYLGDIKFTRDGEVASTPDGNAFYSWCIIRELQKRGYDVVQIMPDRDEKGFEIMGDALFDSWLGNDRLQAYKCLGKVEWFIDGYLEDAKLRYGSDRDNYNIAYCVAGFLKKCIAVKIESVCRDMEFILHEYRMLIPGRNSFDNILSEYWQPDWIIQECLFDYCCREHKKLILFDLDYKMDFDIYQYLSQRGCELTIFDLGTKWLNYKCSLPYFASMSVEQVFIPFDFDNIDYYSIPDVEKRKVNLVYVGNRYERDWCIDKYIPQLLDGCTIYGNWLEGNRDSKKIWSKLHFGQRLQTRDMRYVYSESVATILLAKEEYCEYDFMTARIIEALFYGTVPLFIEEYGEKTIKRYAGDYADFLTVRNAMDVCRKVEILRNMSSGAWINVIIEYMRDRLKFMDVKYFVDVIEEVTQ